MARGRGSRPTALRRHFADLSAKNLDCGSSASHHHGFRVQPALVQRRAPIIKSYEDIELTAPGPGPLMIKLKYDGHTAEYTTDLLS